MATLYVFTLTIPSASAVYWAFGDALLDHSNAFALLPKNAWRDAAVILMLIHQVNYKSFTLLHPHLVNFVFEVTEVNNAQCVCAVYNVRIRVYAIVFRVGESDWDA